MDAGEELGRSIRLSIPLGLGPGVAPHAGAAFEDGRFKTVTHSASPSPSAPPAVEPPRPAWRRRLGALKRPAEFVRGFLQAPLHNRLNTLDASVSQTLGRQEEALGLLSSRFEQVLGALDRQASMQQALMAETGEAVRLQRDVLNLQRQALAAVADQGRSGDAWRADVHTRLDRVDQVLAQVEARATLLATTVGPRFDEIEVKVRPLVPYDDASIAVRLGDGYVLAPKDDPVVLTMLADATAGGFEPGVRQVIRHLARPGMAVADVGANLGLLTLAAARAVGPAGRVYAFEPEARPRDHLRKTLHQNGLAWVELHAVAVGRAPGVARFHQSAVLGHSSLYALPDREAAAVVEVQVETLDRLLAGAPLDLAKIDVEGAELDVLAGMADTLARNPDLALIVEYGPSHLERVGISPQDWFGAFTFYGLTPYAIQEPSGICVRVRANQRRALQAAESTNLVFVRPGGEAERRLPR